MRGRPALGDFVAFPVGSMLVPGEVVHLAGGVVVARRFDGFDAYTPAPPMLYVMQRVIGWVVVGRFDPDELESAIACAVARATMCWPAGPTEPIRTL